MGFLITEEQRKALSDGGIAAVPTTIMAILSSNHARVLDWFREMDTNFDGVISQGEMSYALGALGLNVSPKEVAGVFAVLDPDGDGVIEFDELRRALTNPEKWSGKGPVQKKLTATQRARAKTESEVAKAEMIECIHAFECSRGLQDPAAARPPTAKEALDAARAQGTPRSASSSSTAWVAGASPPANGNGHNLGSQQRCGAPPQAQAQTVTPRSRSPRSGSPRAAGSPGPGGRKQSPVSSKSLRLKISPRR